MRSPRQPVYMLAADHRWQWEEWCDAHDVPRDRIPETKRLALDGLLAARRRSDDVQACGAFLVDATYGAAALARAHANGITAGTPVEKAGAVPLAWASEPFWAGASGDFVKVLVRHRPEWAPGVHQGQLERLRELQSWCRAHNRVFLLEVLVSAADGEAEVDFERTLRPAIVAKFVRDAYEADIVPDFWKIEGTPLAAPMRQIDAAVAERDAPRLVILGKGAGFDAIASWFAAAAPVSRAAGFAIGRSVYWTPAGDFLLGRLSESEAVDVITANYLHIVQAWKEAPRV